MKIRFTINYRTQWGEALFICGDIPALGGGDPDKAFPMSPASPDSWEASIEVPSVPASFSYRYIMRHNNGHCRHEWGKPHSFHKGKGIDRYQIFDSWQEIPPELPYHSSAFVKGIMMRTVPDQPLKPTAGTLHIMVDAPMVKPDEILAITGGCEILGNWDPAQALRLNDSGFPIWTANIPLDTLSLPLEYKFVIVRKDHNDTTAVWEDCPNRIFNIPASVDETVILSGLRFANPRHDWKGAGTAVPVFSLRSDDDFGCGDFLDLKKMILWCEKTEQNILQTLPINDTTKTKTWTDSYPYSANSSFALHPIFVRPTAVGTLKDSKKRKEFEERGAALNRLPQIDYESVTALKEEYMRALYAQLGSSQMKSTDFKSFLDKNAEWLRPYAAWRTLRDRFGTPDTSCWDGYAVYSTEAVDRLFKENPDETGFFLFEQYHLDRQLREVRDFAHLHGVVLKGDIPIGVGRESVDTWKNPELFNMDSQAGAPPDDFSALGQNWGFPTYNWEEMGRDGFRWWKQRFSKMAEYFDAYRIDHILGFFRIWQIPIDALHGVLGYFNPALPYPPEEMRHNYDFWINPDVQTRPLILDWMLGDFFGEYADEVRDRFLVRCGEDRYRLREEVDTQRKVSAIFAEVKNTDKNIRIEQGLLGLLDDVLFIEDPTRKGHYHPRIAAQFTYQYRILNDYERQCFDRLYNDFFYLRHNGFWAGKAMWKLPPIIFSTGMLTCAEDLGMIPDCVPGVMRHLQILSLEIQRMPKDPHLRFGDTWRYPYNSVCTSSTHDMAGIRGWWESDRNTTQNYYNNVLGEPGEAPFFAEPWICDKILDLLLASPSMLCINPIQDWLSADRNLRRNDPREEQINDPANPKHYWRYRLHLSLDQLLEADSFNEALRKRIADSGR